MKAYADARQPVLEHHDGHLILSALNERNAFWDFDGLEILDFHRSDGVQSLMQDEDYRARTKQASAVFSGNFAMGFLTRA